MLLPEQVQVGDVVMGPGTVYEITGFNPFNRTARAPQSGVNPWGHGGYSGAEWLETVPVNFGIHTNGTSSSDWYTKHRALMRAFAPVGTGPDVELRWNLGGTEYLMNCRPRTLSPIMRAVRHGQIGASASVMCLDPHIYSAELHETTIGLLRRIDGMTVPFGIPTFIYSPAVDGTASLVNDGDVSAALWLRITGPVTNPRITVIDPSGVAYQLHIDITLGADDWLDIDTEAQSVILNGSTSRLGDAWGSWPLLQPGTSTLRFEALDTNTVARLRIQWRDRS